MTPLATLAVFAGGGSGAVCRYLIGHLVGSRYGGPFPLGTALINVTGSFLLGLGATLLAGASHPAFWTALLLTGFLGGYTTFSTFALEGVVLFADGDRVNAALSLLLPVALGLAGAALGAALGFALHGVG